MLVAPHGGRSTDDVLATRRARPVRTNDLYTAELSIELATRMNASLVANTEVDRNQVDLHRISEVTRKAPWFLRLVEALVERILRRHAVAEVLFIHGWNVIQPKVDIGIGAALEDGLAAGSVGERLTVSHGYLERRLEALRALCAGAAIHTSYGERYPAAHPNNFLQLFRRVGGRRPAGAGERLLDWAKEGRLEAVQLELGVPLRWPGPGRDNLVRSLTKAFCSKPAGEPEGGSAGVKQLARARAGGAGARRPVEVGTPNPQGASGTEWTTARCPLDAARPHAASVALQAHDPLSGTGILTSIGTAPDGSLAGRLLVFPGGSSLTIFAGQDRPSGALCVGGLSFVSEGSGLLVHFSGPALRVDDARLYVHMESAQARSDLTDVALELRFEPVARPRSGGTAAAQISLAGSYGAVRGQVTIAGIPHRIDTHGFLDGEVARLRAVPGTRLSAAFGPELALVARLRDRDDDAAALRLTPDGWRALRPRRLTVGSESGAALASNLDPAGGPGLARSPGVPQRIVLELVGEEPIVASALSSMAVIRPLPGGGHARVSFGFASFAWGARRGTGFYEHGELVPGDA